jgi:outer membrane protein OmpA-like peptidoglycan-associated protein
MKFSPKIITLALSLAYAHPAFTDEMAEHRCRQADEEHSCLRGKMIDGEGRSYLEALPPSGELGYGAAAFPQGSSLTREDMAAMREAVAKLPATLPREAMSLSESVPGALQSAPLREAKQLSESVPGALFVSGRDALTPEFRARLDELAARLKGKQKLRLHIVGHTDNVRLKPEIRKRFGSNQGLSEARAFAVAEYLMNALGLPASAVAVEGRGETQPVADNGSEAGRTRNRRTEISLWFEESAEPAPQPVPAPVPAPAASEQPPCGTVGAASANGLPFRITVDGAATQGDNMMPEADRERCVDVALAQSDIQVRYDPLQAKPALNAWVYPGTAVRGQPLEFFGYTNYVAWLRKAEIRVFTKDQNVQQTPFAVVPLEWEGSVRWTPPAETPAALFYVLRVYDERGRFDETAEKSLDLVARARPTGDEDKASRERLTGWGEDSRRLANIPVAGGTVTVNGKGIKPGQTVSALGIGAPVDAKGNFALRQILPAGPHTVAVEVRSPDGQSARYSRNLTLADDDWFYVAIGDLTVGRNQVSGPAALVTNDLDHYDGKTYIDGRGAFYLKGKIKGEYLLTMSADTREQPLKDLFSNFSSKDPSYLLRRIDPDRYYPVYGDDSTLAEDAPTEGKFYVRLEKGDSYAMWGSFRTQWTGSELTQYSRALYGANAVWRSEEATRYGEKRSEANLFAAEPGTLASREEQRGTGGSLYYLRHQDVTSGSERVWVEVRDKDSGMVLERSQLVPVQDYDINTLQGRVTLRAPLPSTADGSTLVQTGALSGNPVYLVVTYEFAPGLTATENLAVGLHASHWVNDYVRLGVTGYRQGDPATRQNLGGLDATLRYKPGTFVKVEAARSDGPGGEQLSSINGGFNFNSQTVTGEAAGARRVEGQLDFAEVSEDFKGKASAYVQERDMGYSAPGMLTVGEAQRQMGGRLNMPVGEATTVEIKADDKSATSQTLAVVEAKVEHRLTEEWLAAVALRSDNRTTVTPNASAILSENGDRSDAQLRLGYRGVKPGAEGSKPVPEDWDAYGFVQGTLQRTGDRQENDRLGGGGSWQITDRFRINSEMSAGDGGPGGKLGGDYRIDDRSNVYLTYTQETERPDANWRGRYGTWVSGTSYKLSDQMAVFGETRATHGAGPESLTNAFGVDLAPDDRWTYGVKAEVGTISDPLAGDLHRHALGLSAAYKYERVKYAGSIEYRSEQGTTGNRLTWLMRNAFGYQVDPSWRLLGKLNFSTSTSSQGAFQDGNFAEVVAGAAYRPVTDDRWNTLMKYTYFFDVPAPDQLTAAGETANYSQKSHVFAIDSIYDVKPWMSLGGKVAYRISELRQKQPEGDWFDSRAEFLAVRADWHWIRRWDAVAEWRTLSAPEASDARAGWLLAAYRHFDKNVKAGVGYNFTHYSDNLTDLSYSSHGWFVNVVGKF